MDIEKITYLKKFFEELYELYNGNFKLKDKTRLVDFNKELEEIGISSKLTPKEIELKLQQLYEILEKKQDPLTKTTINKDESEQFIKEEKKRNADIKETRDNQTKAVEDFIKRNQQQIAKAQTAQEEIKDKKVYVKIEETEKVELAPEEKEVLEEYKKEAIENPEEASIKMAREIHSRVDPILKEQGLPQEEIETVVNKTAERIVENLAVYDTPNYIPTPAHIAINNAVFEKIPVTVSQNAQDVIKASIATNSVYRFQPDLFLKDVAKTAFGDNFAKVIFGADPNTYKISVSETPSSQYSYTYSFADSNESSIQILHEQNQTIETLKGFGEDEARNYLVNQSATYFSKTAIGQKILSNSKAEIAFYSAFKDAGKTVTWTGGNFVGNTIIKFAPEYAPVVNLLTGTKFVTPVITETAIKTAGGAVVKEAVGKVATDVGVKVGLGALLVKGAAAIGVSLGVVTAGISTLVTAAIMAIGKAINWPKVKKFFSQYVLPVVVGGGLIMFGAPLAGLVAGGLLFGVARGATLAGIGVGIFNFFGIIGRSIGIAIATPVIVTLLVLPPLVAFIILVINNSAYVVPPFSSSSSTGADNPYLLVTKTAEPSKISNPTSKTTVTYTVSLKALKTALTNIKIVSTECTVTSKAKSSVCPPENIPAIDPTLSISPTSPYTFTFAVDYSSFYTDSLVYDSIEISADSTEETGITTSGSATLCIGDCPTDCVNVDDPSWNSNSNGQANLTSALATLSGRYQGFMVKVCAQGKPVKMCYTTSNPSPIGDGLCNNTIFAKHVHGECDVNFNQCGIKSESDALFILTHELTHHVQKIDGPSTGLYVNTGAFNELAGKGFCSYTSTKDNEYEAMAEANGLFASIPSWGRCFSNYKSFFPKNYMFAKKFME